MTNIDKEEAAGEDVESALPPLPESSSLSHRRDHRLQDMENFVADENQVYPAGGNSTSLDSTNDEDKTEAAVDDNLKDSNGGKDGGGDSMDNDKGQRDARGMVRKITATTQKWLAPVWADRRIGLALAGTVAAMWGVLAGWWMPRGPLTARQVMASIFLSLIVTGWGCGLVTRSLWTLLVVPVTFQFFLEVMRVRVDGPTVDKPHFSAYGAMALASGRGVQFILTVFPMMVGIPLGVTAAHRISQRGNQCHERWVRYASFAAIGLGALGLLVLIVMLAIPARTTSIDGKDSIAELTTVHVNGHDLALMIRGRSVQNPVLLYLAGGPGGSELGAMRNHLQELEDHFIVITWDQRGCGKSYVELDPLDTISLEGYIDDTSEVTDYLQNRFNQNRIYLLGQSWGSLLGVLVVQEYAEKYEAYIGTGQMVSALATDMMMYNDTLTWARSTGRDSLVDDLVSNGPPPYENVYPYEHIVPYQHDIFPYDHSVNSEGEGGFTENFNAEEYNLIERLHLFAAFLDTYAILYPQIQDIDFRQDGGSTFETPVFFVQGAHEFPGRSKIFDEWYPTITAPIRDLVVLNTSGHRPLFEQPHEFLNYMVNTVLAWTTSNAGNSSSGA